MMTTFSVGPTSSSMFTSLPMVPSTSLSVPTHAATTTTSKRGLSMTWRSTADVAQHFSLAEHSVQLLSDLSSTALSILNGERDFINILHTMVCEMSWRPTTSSASSTRNVPSPFGVGGSSLGAIVARVKGTEKRGLMLEFEHTITLIQFVIKLDVLSEAEAKSTLDIIREAMQDRK